MTMLSLRKITRKISKIEIEEKSTKKVVRKKNTVTEFKEQTKKIVKRKNVIYEYTKEGQKKKAPILNDPLRRFYTSLLRQKPHSQIAINWCIQHGLFPGQSDNIHCHLSKLAL